MQNPKSNDFRHIEYTCYDGISRVFSPCNMADLKNAAPLLLTLLDNDPWVVFLFSSVVADEVKANEESDAAMQSPLSSMEFNALINFLTVIFSKKYCDKPVKKKDIPEVVDTIDIRHLITIANGTESRLKKERFDLTKSNN